MEMNILIAIDDNYVEQAITMLNSLFINNNESKFHIYLLYNKCSNTEIFRLKRFVKKHKNEFTSRYVDDQIFKKAPKRSHTTIESYFRILAFSVLAEVNKILYMDPDMIVTGDICELYKTDLNDKAIAGIPDYGINHLYKSQKSILRISEQYINGGLLLMDLDKMRTLSTLDHVLKSFFENQQRFPLQDQDFINYYYKNYILCVDTKYNTDVWFRNYPDILIEPFYFVLKRKPPVIIHFMGAEYKPWSCSGYGGKYIKEYMKYSYLKECKNLHNKVYINYKRWWITYFNLLKRYINGEELAK